MPIAILFWVCWVVFFILALCFRRDKLPDVLCGLALFFILGWKVFGFIAQ